MANEFDRLLDLARGGDRQAVQTLLEPHLPGLAAFLRVQCGALLAVREGVDDLVQSVCRRAISGIEGARSGGTAQFRNWLFTVALSAVNDKLAFHRAAKRDVGREAAVVDSRVSDGALVAAYRRVVTPSRQAVAREEIERIESALARLPDDYRDVLVLAAIAELPRAEIGARMGKSEAAVRQLLARARARLVRVLNGGD